MHHCCLVMTDFKGKLRSKKSSRDIPSQSHEFEQDGHRHLVGFQPHFSSKYDVTDTIQQNNEKMQMQYLSSLLFDLSEILLLELSKGISVDFKFCCYGN